MTPTHADQMLLSGAWVAVVRLLSACGVNTSTLATYRWEGTQEERDAHFRSRLVARQEFERALLELATMYRDAATSAAPVDPPSVPVIDEETQAQVARQRDEERKHLAAFDWSALRSEDNDVALLAAWRLRAMGDWMRSLGIGAEFDATCAAHGLNAREMV